MIFDTFTRGSRFEALVQTLFRSRVGVRGNVRLDSEGDNGVSLTATVFEHDQEYPNHLSTGTNAANSSMGGWLSREQKCVR